MTKKNPDNDSEKESELSPEEESELDSFWTQYGKTSVNEVFSKMDERAKYMITTCASLIVIHFGLLIGFKIEDISVKITPEFFFVVAAGAFAFSLFPVPKTVLLQSAATIQDAYHSSLKWRTRAHYIGFGFFIAGLLSMAITVLIS